MKKSTRKYCDSIAKFYGVNVTWTKGEEGWYIPGTNKIIVGTRANDTESISVFCHEMAHYLNFVNGKYAAYHSGGDFRKRFKTKTAGARYALKAELYTDKVGRRFCKMWFPEIKYKTWYKDNKLFLNALKKYNYGTKIA
jgi:hypothetical protein